MEEPRHPRLYGRLKDAFGPTYLTVLSIIQGVALTDLAAVVAAEHARFTLVNWLLVPMNFAVLVVTWNVYAQQSVMWTWIPDLRDSAIPFLVGATELFLNHALAESLTAWFLGLAAFAFVGAFATQHITWRAGEDPENVELLGILRTHHLRFSLYLAANGVLLLILALVSRLTGADAGEWGRGPAGWVALVLALATGASFSFAFYFADGYQRKTVAYARDGHVSDRPVAAKAGGRSSLKA